MEISSKMKKIKFWTIFSGFVQVPTVSVSHHFCICPSWLHRLPPSENKVGKRNSTLWWNWMSYILYTWYHGITQNEDNKFLFRPVSESQLHELRLLRDLKDWVRFLSQPKYVCMNLYFLCICLINLISSVAKQWTDQLCQRKLSSGRSQCWTSLLTYWSAQLRFPKTLPI